MNLRFAILALLGASCGLAARPLPPEFTPIGPVASFQRVADGVDLACADGSAVRIRLLASDLVRVRASFRRPMPAFDHSWAIARTDWPTPEWKLTDSAEDLRLTTADLEVRVRRSPLLIEFRDARTGQVINADFSPMGFDPHGAGVGARKRLGLDEHFYGLGEKATHLDKRRQHFEMWNTDRGFTWDTDPVYQSIPFYLGWSDGRAYGIFFDNSYRSHFDFGSVSQEHVDFWADGGEMNYYFLAGPSIRKILGRYADLTGHMPLPPRWALGNQQSRYSYYPDSLAEAIVRRYRADALPLDVLHLDIHYMRGYRVFTFDPNRFPHPREFTDRLRRLGVKVVTIVDPGIKYEPEDSGYPVFTEGRDRGYFLKRSNGELYIGEVWPGKAVFVDYTLPDAARWWGDLHRFYLDAGVAGIWDDMNEPSDFVDKTGASQKDVVSYDEGTHSLYGKNRNVFALGEARATYEGLRRLRPRERPYLITRAAYAGIQRYSTMWTGDNNSRWEDLSLTIPEFATLGLSGEPFVGADIPGFNGRADGELMVRWYEAGCLAPFCRNHGSIDSYDHEPWRFGKDDEAIVRRYLRLRYALLPYLYTALEEAHRTGVPLYRPLLLNFQEDANTLDIDDEFMVGDALLAAPIVAAGQMSRRVYLPEGLWYEFGTGRTHPGGQTIVVDAPLDTLPLFVRGGTALPMTEPANYVGEDPHAPIHFRVYPDADGHAEGSLYEDDGTSPDYETGGFRRTFVAVRPGAEPAVRTEGNYTPPERTIDFSAPQ